MKATKDDLKKKKGGRAAKKHDKDGKAKPAEEHACKQGEDEIRKKLHSVFWLTFDDSNMSQTLVKQLAA